MCSSTAAASLDIVILGFSASILSLGGLSIVSLGSDVRAMKDELDQRGQSNSEPRCMIERTFDREMLPASLRDESWFVPGNSDYCGGLQCPLFGAERNRREIVCSVRKRYEERRMGE